MKRRKNKLISGVEYWRCRRQIRKCEIDAILSGGINYENWSRPDTLLEASSTGNLLKIADLLDVTVDQLFEVHSVAELEDGDRPQYRSMYADPGNCLSNYRIIKGLSFQQLGERLGGVSRQYAQMLYRDSNAPDSGIERICAYEKITPEEFVRIYSETSGEVTLMIYERIGVRIRTQRKRQNMSQERHVILAVAAAAKRAMRETGKTA